MPTYNGILIPDMIRTNRIISAFCNPVDPDKIEDYTERMLSSEDYLPDAIPAISGYPDILTDDSMNEDLYFINGEPVSSQHIGQLVWYVTDGHHRSIAANNAELPFLNVEIDPSTFTDEQELIDWRNRNSIKRVA